MLSSRDLKSVQYMIEQSDYQERDYLREHAIMELAVAVNQGYGRVLTDREQRAFDFAIATLNQINTKSEHGGGHFVPEQRNKFVQ